MGVGDGRLSNNIPITPIKATVNKVEKLLLSFIMVLVGFVYCEDSLPIICFMA